jgi:hypothetical protein
MSRDEESILAQFERELPSNFGVETPQGLVFHYTDAAAMSGIVSKGKIWATHFMHLNDRRELLEGEDLVREVAKEMRQTTTGHRQELWTDFETNFDAMVITQIVRDLYVVSFSEDGDDLDQWRAYGGRGGGYAIGVTFKVATDDENAAAQTAGFGGTMLKVRYDREEAREKVRKDLSEAFNAIERYVDTYGSKVAPIKIFKAGMVAAYQRAARIAPILKHKAFEREREWRLIVTLGDDVFPRFLKTRPSPSGVVPYVEVPLEQGKPDGPANVERLVVGPTQDRERGLRSAELFLRSLGYDRARAQSVVVASEVPFRG